MAKRKAPVEQIIEQAPVAEAPVEQAEIPAEAPMAEIPAEAPAAEAPVQRASGVGKRVRFLLQEGIEDNKGILATIQKEFPNAKTTMACIAWYKADMKKKKMVDDKPFQDWCKTNGFDQASLRAKFEAEQVKTEA